MDGRRQGRRPTARLTGPVATTSERPPGEPLVGWRYWRLNAGTGRLTSVSQRGFSWEVDAPLVARCVGGGHVAPDPGCSCGVHASADLASLRDHALCLAPGVLVVGEVALWGRIVRDDHGYRGRLAAPRRLWLVDGDDDDQATLEVLRGYGVPVATMAAGEALGDASAATMAFLAMSGPPPDGLTPS